MALNLFSISTEILNIFMLYLLVERFGVLGEL